MPNLVPRSTHAMQSDERLNAEIADAERPGLNATARLHAGGFASSVAMANALALSRAADAAFRASPMGEEIYRSILLAYGAFATNEITRLAFHDGGQR